MSYLTQMAGLAYHNFVSAAVGIALAIAFIRGIAARERDTIGNFWVDMTRASLWVLLPFCIAGALLLVSQGVVQNLRPYDRVQLVDGAGEVKEQVIAQGPVASQEIIKEWGTNGGGFFNANSAHPFENPTPFSNFIEMFAIFAISAGLTYTLGRMTKSPRHGWAVFAAMTFLFLAGVTTAYWAEAAGNPLLAGTDQTPGAMCPGGNMEGKEARFGIANSALFATITTDASCGAVNSMHDSFTPLGGMVPLVNIMLGEVIFGGVGAGHVRHPDLRGAVGVHRRPDGRPHAGVSGQEDRSVRRADGDARDAGVPADDPRLHGYFRRCRRTSARRASGTPVRTGLSEILYAYTSGTGNNGSAFAGISANTKWYNTTLGIAMLLGRFMIIVPMLALAGNLGRKKEVPASLGTFPVTTPLFTTLLVGVIVIVGVLTFFPVLSLGPIVEHFLMRAGTTFLRLGLGAWIEQWQRHRN